MSERFDWTALSDQLKSNQLVQTLNVRLPRISRALWEVPRTFFDAQRFGARPDGLTDNTKALQNWLNTAAGAGIAWLPAGRYAYTGQLTIPSDTELVGAGWKSVLSNTNTGIESLFLNSNTASGNTNIRLRDFSLEGGSGDTASHLHSVAGILLKSVTGFEIRGVRVTKCFGIAIAYQASTDGKILFNYVTNSRGADGITGFWLTGKPVLADIIVGYNRIHNVGDDGVAFVGGTDVATRPRRLVAIGNVITTADVGGVTSQAGRGLVSAGCQDVAFVGNSVYNTFASTVRVTADDTAVTASQRVAVTGNILVNGGQLGAGVQDEYGIYFWNSQHVGACQNQITNARQNGIRVTTCDDFTLTDNDLTDCGVANSGTGGMGIYLNGNPGANTNGRVRGNAVIGSGAGGIYSVGNDDVALHDNHTRNNGQAGAGANNTLFAGIIVEGGSTPIGTSVRGNHALDTQGSPTQSYGVAFRGTPTIVDLTDNRCYGNGFGPITGTVTTLYRRGNHFTTGALTGQAVLVSGTATVLTAEVTAAESIVLSRVVGGGAARGILEVGTIVAGTSFVVNAMSTLGAVETNDSSTVFWEIIH